MSNRKKFGLAFAGLLVIQIIPLPRDNPPVEQEIAAPAEVREVLVRSCYDCHSHATAWPWYAWVAPASWLVAYDVHEGREHLNFHRWFGPADARAHKLEELVEEVEEEAMPLPIYLPLHPEARLGPAERALLIDWARAMADDARREADAGS